MHLLPQELGAPGASVRALAFRAPGRVVAVGRLDGTVELWSWREGVRLAAFPAHRGVVVAALPLQDGCQLVTAGEDGEVSGHRRGAGDPGEGAEGAGGAGAALSPGILGAGPSCWRLFLGECRTWAPVLGSQVQVWSGALGRLRGLLGPLPLSAALCVALSPDGDWVAVGYREDGIRTYEVASGAVGTRGGWSRGGASAA